MGGGLLCLLVLIIAHPTTAADIGLATFPGEGAAPPLLTGQHSPTCSVPRGSQDRADLHPCAFSCPGEHENIPGACWFPPCGRAWLGAARPVRNGLSSRWVSSVTFVHKWWLSVRASGKGAAVVGAMEGSCKPRAPCEGKAVTVHVSCLPANKRRRIPFLWKQLRSSTTGWSSLHGRQVWWLELCALHIPGVR